MRNPRRANSTARNRLRARIASEGRRCWICAAFGRDARIDYSLPAGHPMAYELDELCPVSKWREGGYTSPQACALDPANVDATHRSCNLWRGNRSVRWVMKQAAMARGGLNVPPARDKDKTSRKW